MWDKALKLMSSLNTWKIYFSIYKKEWSQTYLVEMLDLGAYKGIRSLISIKHTVSYDAWTLIQVAQQHE